MTSSLRHTAQLTLTRDVGMDAALELRAQLQAEWARAGRAVPSITDLVLRASALALRLHPRMNARIDEDRMVEQADIHLGLAVALDDGLVVPVIRYADEHSLGALAGAAHELAAAAREGRLGPEAFAGATFTVSSLGTEGVDVFTPILHSPNVGILGVGRVRHEVVWSEAGPAPSRRLTLSLTWDHRALDGVPAARFAAEVARLLEAPLSLLS